MIDISDIAHETAAELFEDAEQQLDAARKIAAGLWKVAMAFAPDVETKSQQEAIV